MTEKLAWMMYCVVTSCIKISTLGDIQVYISNNNYNDNSVEFVDRYFQSQNPQYKYIFISKT